MKLKYSLIILLFSVLTGKANAQVDIQLRNTGSLLEVWLMPKATYTGPVSSLTFAISWDVFYNVNLAEPTSFVPEIPIALDRVVNGNRRYNVYAASSLTDVTLTNNTPVKIMTASLTGPGSGGAGQFSISNDAFTAANNFDFFIEMAGQEFGKTLDITGASSSIATSVVLALNLVSFKAIEQDNQAFLSWKTTNEVDFSHFDVERSVDAKTWTMVRLVKGKYPNTEGVYEWTDEKAFEQNNRVLYRLKMVNTDGTFTYSNIQTLVRKEKSKESIKLYPNPTYNDVYLTIESPYNSVKKLEIVDMSGKVYQEMSINVIKGQNQQTLDVRALPIGAYFLIAKDRTGTGRSQAIRVIKLQ
jgi:hypothetical protein